MQLRKRARGLTQKYVSLGEMTQQRREGRQAMESAEKESDKIKEKECVPVKRSS